MKRFIGGVIIGTVLGCVLQPHLNTDFMNGKTRCHIGRSCKRMNKRYKRLKRTAFRTYKDFKAYIME